MAKRRLLFATGIAMVALSVAGFATVADELRHTGEFFGVSAILLGGLALIVAASNILSRWFAFGWLTAGLLLGALLGVAADHMPAGVVGGFVLGTVVAYLRRERRPAGDARA